MIFVWFSSGPRCPIKSILICQIESAVNANVYKHLICEQVHYENARNNIARGICVEVEWIKSQRPPPPAAPYWATTSKLRSLLTFPSSLVGAWRRLRLKHPHAQTSLLTFSSHVRILAHLFITHGDPCSPFHHTWGSLLTFSSHVGILAHLFITHGDPLLTFSSHVGILAHLFITRGDPCSPFHHTWESLLTFSSHVGILAHLFINTWGSFAHLFITRGDPCSPFHHTRDPCSPFHHTWGSLLTFSSHVGTLAHLFITHGDPCSPFHHTWGS